MRFALGRRSKDCDHGCTCKYWHMHARHTRTYASMYAQAHPHTHTNRGQTSPYRLQRDVGSVEVGLGHRIVLFCHLGAWCNLLQSCPDSLNHLKSDLACIASSQSKEEKIHEGASERGRISSISHLKLPVSILVSLRKYLCQCVTTRKGKSNSFV